MSTSTLQNPQENARVLPLHSENSPSQPAKDTNDLSLAEVTAATRFSHVAPYIHKSIASLAHADLPLLEILSGNISTLQDRFVESFYQLLTRAGIDVVAHKITVRLNAEGQLALINAHPEKQVVEALLRQYPEYAAAFHELAVQSDALRRIYGLHSMLWQASQPEGVKPDGKSTYQLSLKGDMSHFYFNG